MTVRPAPSKPLAVRSHVRFPSRPSPAALRFRTGQSPEGRSPERWRRHHRPRHGQPRPAGAETCGRQADRNGHEAPRRPLFGIEGDRGSPPCPGSLLRPPLRREARSGPPGRGDPGFEGGLRQHGASHHGPWRCRAGAEPVLPHPRFRVSDGRRRDPVGSGRADARLFLGARTRGSAFDPQTAGRSGLLPVEPDRHGGVARFL